jgi:hypothetical protein
MLGHQARIQAKLRPWPDAIDDLLTNHYPAPEPVTNGASTAA